MILISFLRVFYNRILSILSSFFFYSDLFYVRNHLPVPDINLKDYTLELAIEGTIRKTLDFETIKKKYKKYTITAAVMCGGNRRSEMSKVNALRNMKKILLNLTE